jgi:hypothetical protein
VGGTPDTYVKFTSSTTIGDTAYNVREAATPNSLLLGDFAQNKDFNGIAHSKGMINLDGDVQTNQIIYYGLANPSSTIDLYTDGASERIRLSAGRIIGFEVQVVCGQDTTGYASFRLFQGAIKHNGTNAVIVGTVTETTVAEDVLLAKVTISASGNDLRMTAQEQTGTNRVKITAYVRYTETTVTL